MQSANMQRGNMQTGDPDFTRHNFGNESITVGPDTVTNTKNLDLSTFICKQQGRGCR